MSDRKRDDPLPPTLRRPEGAAPDGDDVDGLLESLTTEDAYREEQPTIPVDVETLAAETRPPPPAPAKAATEPKVPLPGRLPRPRPSDVVTAQPPVVNPAGPPRREPFPPAMSPAPGPAQSRPPLPRQAPRKFQGPTGFDDSEIDRALMPLSEPPPAVASRPGSSKPPTPTLTSPVPPRPSSSQPPRPGAPPVSIQLPRPPGRSLPLPGGPKPVANAPAERPQPAVTTSPRPPTAREPGARPPLTRSMTPVPRPPSAPPRSPSARPRPHTLIDAEPPSVEAGADSWAPPDLEASAESLIEVEAAEGSTPIGEVEEGTAVFRDPSEAPTLTGDDDAPAIQAEPGSFDEWEEEPVTSIRSTDSAATESAVEVSSTSLEELGVDLASLDEASGHDLAGELHAEVAAQAGGRSAAAELGNHRLIDAWMARVEWFEAEAQATEDPAARARLLLAASELAAMAGDTPHARDLSRRASQALPSLTLATRQARFVAAADGDWKSVATALDLEARAATTDAARAHAACLAAEIHRLRLSDAQSAERRLDLAARALPTDPRPHVARLAATLAGKEPGGGPKWPEDPSLAPLTTAASELARLRGWAKGTSAARTPGIAFQEARRALGGGDRARAGAAVRDLGDVPGVGSGARLLAAALFAPAADTRALAIELLTRVTEEDGTRAVRRALAARALEQSDAGAMTRALEEKEGAESAFDAADRVALGALAGGDAKVLEAAIATVLGDEAQKPLAAAAAAALTPGASSPVGDPATRALLAVGRKLSTVTSPEELKDTVHALRAAAPSGALGRILALELDAAASATSAVAAELSRLAPPDEQAQGRLAAAMLEEASGHTDVARRHYSAALAAPSVAEAAARALVPPGQPGASDLLSTLASALGEEATPRQALLLFEAAVLGGFDDAAATNDLLLRSHEAAPHLPFAGRLASDLARNRGDAAALLEWTQKQRNGTKEPLIRALHLVREALLTADEDAAGALARVTEALEVRPDDVTLHELAERLGEGPGEPRGRFREELASRTEDARTRAWLLLSAAREYERAGASEPAARAALLASETGGSEVARLSALRLSNQAPPPRRGLAEQRAREHELLGEDKHEELEAVASSLVDLNDRGEATAHARLAARLRIRRDTWDGAREIVERVARHTPRSLWTLRELSAHAHTQSDAARIVEVDRELAERVPRASDGATLRLRAAEAAARLGRVDDAIALLDQTLEASPEHLVARDLRAQLHAAKGEAARTAEDFEALAGASRVPRHQWDAWYHAAVLWLDRTDQADRGLSALERAAAIDPVGADVFDRLQLIYVQRGDRAKLAQLLERRLEQTTDPQERIALEVTRGRALAEVGDREAARRALGAALEASPDHLDALEAFAGLCAEDGDWKGAEEAWIRLARVAGKPEKQAAIYAKLARLYETDLPNPQRAEICCKEILKRLPDDLAALETLVRVYVAAGNVVKAVETQTGLVDRTTTPEDKRDRTLALARVYDDAAKDKKSSFAILDKARKAWPHDPHVLRALAEHHEKHGETAALNVLLDRAAAEARRALAHGRFDPAFFGILEAAAEVRGQADSARIASATVAALEGGGEVTIAGAGAGAADPALDDLLAPELLSPAFRALLGKLPTVFETAYPVDLKALRAAPPAQGSGGPADEIRAIADSLGIRSLEVLVSPGLGSGIIASSSPTPRLVIGQALLSYEDAPALYFAVIRALKMLKGDAAALTRVPPIELLPVMAALFKVLTPGYTPQGVDATKLIEAERKVRVALPQRVDDDLPTLALEVSGSLGNRASQLGQAVGQWASRTALLATGSADASLRGIALALGQPEGPPRDPAERLKWVLRHPEARDVAVFSVSDAYAEARRRLGLAG